MNWKNYFGGTLFKDSLCFLPSPDKTTVRQFWPLYSVQDFNSLSEIENDYQVNSLFSSPIRRRRMFYRLLTPFGFLFGFFSITEIVAELLLFFNLRCMKHCMTESVVTPMNIPQMHVIKNMPDHLV